MENGLDSIVSRVRTNGATVLTAVYTVAAACDLGAGVNGDEVATGEEFLVAPDCSSSVSAGIDLQR